MKEIPKSVVEKANKHAGGAIVEVDRQLQTARSREKISRLRRKRSMWQDVFEQTSELLKHG